MKSKRLMALFLCAMMVLAMSACGAESAEGSTAPGVESPAGVPETIPPTDENGTDVNFGLQTAPDPNFDSPATGGSSDKIYTIEGDYAYELDPSTFQTIGPPLDPITHEPVDNPVIGGQNPSTPNNPQNSNPPESQPPASQPPASQPPTATPDPSPAPTGDSKLPNMGMFLEDD